MQKLFVPADLLIPYPSLLPKWSVVAVDQYTSEPTYWDRVTRATEGVPSARALVLPEAYLGKTDEAAAIAAANRKMQEYLEGDVFRTFPGSYVWVTRTLSSGRVRRGLVGAVDLAAYDYHRGSHTPVRATEKTVPERIPPRVRLRANAPLELPHTLLLYSDFRHLTEAFLRACADRLPVVYDFDLMEGGGHIRGALISGETAKALSILLARLMAGSEIGIAVGDGNHSLAAALDCFAALKAELGEEAAMAHPARYALAELENIADPGIVFEPIHRLVRGNPAELLDFIRAKKYTCAPVSWHTADGAGTVCVAPDNDTLVCAGVQALLEEYTARFGAEVDYIHDDDTLLRLAAAPGYIGFLLPPFPKSELLPSVEANGTLPRKAFSMGSAADKRFYLEARKIR